jgi:hypothetical protein
MRARLGGRIKRKAVFIMVKYKFCSVIKFDEIEQWLTSMAREGYELRIILFDCIFVFRKSKPKNIEFFFITHANPRRLTSSEEKLIRDINTNFHQIFVRYSSNSLLCALKAKDKNYQGLQGLRNRRTGSLSKYIKERLVVWLFLTSISLFYFALFLFDIGGFSGGLSDIIFMLIIGIISLSNFVYYLYAFFDNRKKRNKMKED